MKIGELVYSGHMMEIGHMVLGVVLDRKDSDRTIYRIFWVDSVEPAWYYESEVERIDATG
jgi:hypothetical protein